MSLQTFMKLMLQLGVNILMGQVVASQLHRAERLGVNSAMTEKNLIMWLDESRSTLNEVNKVLADWPTTE